MLFNLITIYSKLIVILNFHSAFVFIYLQVYVYFCIENLVSTHITASHLGMVVQKNFTSATSCLNVSSLYKKKSPVYRLSYAHSFSRFRPPESMHIFLGLLLHLALIGTFNIISITMLNHMEHLLWVAKSVRKAFRRRKRINFIALMFLWFRSNDPYMFYD